MINETRSNLRRREETNPSPCWKELLQSALVCLSIHPFELLLDRLERVS